MSLVAELKRRNVIRMAGLYLVAAWLVVQVAGTVLPMFEAPAWVPRTVVVLLAIGFVPVLIFSWVFELTAEGLKRESEVPREAPTRRLTGRRIDFAIIAVLLAALGYFAIDKFVLVPRQAARGAATTMAPAPQAHAIRSIAVLPLDNYSGDPSQDYFAEGMTDELTADLAIISTLRVISRGSTTQFRGKGRPPTPQIAKLLDVDAVVEGSVRRIGDKVRITAQLIDARQDKHLWAKSFERSSRDVLELQGELASEIAREVDVQLTPGEQSRLSRAQSVDPEAYDIYLRGRYLFNRPNDENLKKAIGEFEEATRLSPDFAPAYAGLSDAYVWAGFNEGFLTSSAAKPKAHAAALKAVSLDNAAAEAHTSLAGYKGAYEFDWAGAEHEFRRAIELNPNYAYAHDQLGFILAMQGRLDESVAESTRAAELDPLNPLIPIDAALAPAFQGDYAAARALTQRAADLDPTFFFPLHVFAWIDIQAGRPGDAVPKLQKARGMGAPGYVTAFYGYACGASGDRAGAQEAILALEKGAVDGYVPPFSLAIVYLGMGDRERALEYLERAQAADSQWLAWLKEDRIFDPLRQEPRFAALLRKAGFGDAGPERGRRAESKERVERKERKERTERPEA